MDKELKNWLEMRWRHDNHAKYRHLFSEWVTNITEGQIAGFRKQMYNDINNVLRTQQYG